METGVIALNSRGSDIQPLVLQNYEQLQAEGGPQTPFERRRKRKWGFRGTSTARWLVHAVPTWTREIDNSPPFMGEPSWDFRHLRVLNSPVANSSAVRQFMHGINIFFQRQPIKHYELDTTSQGKATVRAFLDCLFRAVPVASEIHKIG